MKSRKRKKKGNGGTILLFLLLAVVGFSTGYAWLVLLLTLFYAVGKFATRPPRPEAYVRKAMQNFRSMDMAAWGTLEGDFQRHHLGHPVGNLIYALRIASAVPTLSKVSTLASRWNVAHCGAGDSGLNAAVGLRQTREVADFITALVAEKLRAMLETNDLKLRERMAKAASEATKAKYLTKAESDLIEWETSFIWIPAAMQEIFANYHAGLPQLEE